MGSGGSANQAKLLELMRAGTLRWEKVDEDELVELRKKYPKTRRGKGKKVVEKEEDEAQSSEEEPQVKKPAKKSAKKQQKVVEEEDDSDQEAPPEKGKKRKHDSADGDAAPKKKSKGTKAGEGEGANRAGNDKGKGKAKVVEKVEKAKKPGKDSKAGQKRKCEGDEQDTAAHPNKIGPPGFSKRRSGTGKPAPGRSASFLGDTDDETPETQDANIRKNLL